MHTDVRTISIIFKKPGVRQPKGRRAPGLTRCCITTTILNEVTLAKAHH